MWISNLLETISNPVIRSIILAIFASPSVIMTGKGITKLIKNSIVKTSPFYKASEVNHLSLENFSYYNDDKALNRREQIDYEKFEIIKSFIETLEKNIPAKNMKIAYTNLTNDFNIQKMKKNIFSSISGRYYAFKNLIEYANKNALGHELLHLASTIVYEAKGIVLFGFLQKHVQGMEIGRGINEGYTDLLSKRIFNEHPAYVKQVKLAKLVEFFFDNPKDMENLYFSCDLYGLITHMSKFAEKKEVIEFILRTDKLMKASVLDPNYTRMQIRLYKWSKAANFSPEKQKQFEELLCKDKLVSMFIRKKKYKLYPESFAFTEKNMELTETNIK